MSRYITISAEVEVDLREIDTEDLLEELNKRGGKEVLLEMVDNNELNRLVQNVQVALYTNNQETMMSSVEAYFHRVHGITTH